MRFSLLDPDDSDVGGARTGLRVGMPGAILAALLLDANHVVPTQRLISALWGENPPPSAGASLYNHVARLRRSMGADGASRIRSASAGYLVRVADEELDLQVFTDLYQRGRKLMGAGDWGGAAAILSTALSMWKADPLKGMPPTMFFRAEARRLAELRLEVVRSRIEAHLNLGNHDRLVPELMALSVEHPLSEVFHGHLMLALYRSGRPSEALRAYHDIRARLNGDLGVDPGPELSELHTRMLQHDAWLTRRPANGRGGTPHGDAVDARRFPVPRQLPNGLIDFTGREERVERLRSLLVPHETPGAAIMTAVTGGAGVGKTALAVHVAHLVAADFPDGQLYAELGDTGPILRRSHDVLATFLRELGVSEPEQPADQEARAARYRTLLNGRRMLVVLDDARDVEQIRPLLPGSSGCAVLISSRNRLSNLPGVDHLHLDVLDDCEARRMFTRIVGVERAAVSPAATAAVLDYCAGLPLALRIVATRLTNRPSWSVVTLAARLSAEDVSSSDIGGALRGSFDASYTRLAEQADDVDLSRLFRRLALVPGPDFGVAEASAVLGGSWSDATVRRALERLVDAHLVSADDDGRYRFHSLTRMYAWARAAEDEPAIERHAALARLRSDSLA